MVRWILNHVSSPVLLVLVVAVTVAVGVGFARLHARRRAGQPARSDEMLTLTLNFVGVAYAILVGFVIVNLWQDQSSAREAVSAEASALRDIVTISKVLPAPERDRIVASVRSYSDIVIHEEWHLLRTGGKSERARDSGDAILTAITSVDTSSTLSATLQASMIESFKDFRGLRTRRVAFADVHLAAELWLLVVLTSGVIVLLVGAFEGEGKWHLGATVITAGTIGTILFAMLALSYPFSGEVSVSPKPFIDLVRSLGA